MALKENPELVLRKFEELKKWQKQQEEKLRIEQESQRDLLMAAQRRMYEEYNRDFRGSSRSSYNDESRHETSLESFPRIASPDNASPPPERKTQFVRDCPKQPCISFDDVPVPSPQKDFNELLGEKLRQSSEEKPKDTVPSKIVKRPFLRKGQGLVKYRLNPDLKKPAQKPSTVSMRNENYKISTNKPKPFVVDQQVDKIPDFSNGLSVQSNGPSVKATWANVLSKNKTESACSEFFASRPLSPDQRAWTPSGSESSPNKLVGSNKLTKKELEDLRLFELLEQKAANSSFCSSSSTIVRLLEKSHQSTPNKTSARERQLSLRDFRVSPLRLPPNIDRSPHVRFADQDNYNFFQKPADDSDFDQSSCDISEDCGEPLAARNVPLFIGRDADGQKIDTGLSTIEESPSNFEDNEKWSDGCSSLASESSEEDDVSMADKTIEEDVVKEAPPVEKIKEKRTTSPTETLVRTAVEGVAYKSELLRKRLQELESEIETFRKENASLMRMKRLHELDVANFAKEKKETERAFHEKQEELTNLLDVERKKLQKDKKVFEKYYKELKSQPSKMEREEITALKLQVENLREELVKKDSRWSATQVRTRDRLKHLEAENVALKSQLADLKRERQEWQKRRASLPNQAPSRVLDTKVIHAINTHIGRIKPADFKDAAPNKRKPPPIKEQRSALLTNRPIWGARNNVKPTAPIIRRTKSVPDVRPQSPQGPQCKKAVRIQTYNVESSETETESESESDCDLDDRSSGRVEKLRQTVYDAYYGNFHDERRESPPPREKSTKSVVVDLTKSKDDSNVISNGVAVDEVPEFLTSITRQIAYYKANLEMDEKKTEVPERPEAEPLPDSLASQNKNSIERAPEVNPPIYEINSEKDRVADVDDKTPTEIVRANGCREKAFPDGRKEIWYPNGNVKKVSADRSVVKIVYFNGDVKETLAKSGLVKYYYAESKTWHSTYNDGTEILEFANGQRERRTVDGVSEITFPNGCVRVIHADGHDEWISPDGTRVSTDAHGGKVAQLANGQREIHTATHKRREYPDGTVKLLYPDGLQETRYANGRIRIKDKDGNLVMDSDDQAA